jgi:hypothetical protein
MIYLAVCFLDVNVKCLIRGETCMTGSMWCQSLMRPKGVAESAWLITTGGGENPNFLQIKSQIMPLIN